MHAVIGTAILVWIWQRIYLRQYVWYSHLFISCKKCVESNLTVAAIKKGASIEAKNLGDKLEALNANMEEQIKLSIWNNWMITLLRTLLKLSHK